MTKSTSELFEFNKMLFIYASTVLIVFFWFLKMIVNRKIILKKTPLDIPILIFFLSQLISTVTSIDRHTSIFGYYGRFNGGLLSILCYIMLYYVFISNKVNVEKVLKMILSSSLLVVLWAIPGHFGHDLTCLLFTGQFSNSCWDNTTLAFRPELRAFSTLGQPNWLGAYLAASFFIGIYFLLKNQKSNIKYQNDRSKIKNIIWENYLTPVYLFLNFSMILMSRSRSAIGAVIVGLILFVGYYWFFIKTNFKKILLILLLVTIIPVFLFKTGEEKIDKYISISNIKNKISLLRQDFRGQAKIQFKNQKETTNNSLQPATSLNITESFDIRKIVWAGAWKLAMKYPLFGTGVETFAYSYNFVRPASHNLTSEWDYVYNKAHNEYFNYLATTGFLGLGSYLILIGAFIFFLISKIKYQKSNIQIKNQNETLLTVCLLISYITILITNFFGFSTTTIQLFFFLIPALVFSADTNRLVSNSLVPNQLTNIQKFLILLLVSSTIYFLFSISVYYLADINFSLGSKYAKVDDQQRAVGYLEKSIKLRKEPVYEDRFSSTLSYLAAVASIQNQKELGKQIAVMSDTYNRKLIQAYPKNAFYWKTRAKNMFYFYQATGNENEILQGIRALKKAQELSPSDPKISYSLALYYTTLFDVTKDNLGKQNWKNLSLDEIDKTIVLKSNYREAYLFKGQLLKKYGLIVEAKKTFEDMLKNFNAKDAEVLKELQSF